MTAFSAGLPTIQDRSLRTLRYAVGVGYSSLYDKPEDTFDASVTNNDWIVFVGDLEWVTFEARDAGTGTAAASATWAWSIEQSNDRWGWANPDAGAVAKTGATRTAAIDVTSAWMRLRTTTVEANVRMRLTMHGRVRAV